VHFVQPEALSRVFTAGNALDYCKIRRAVVALLIEALENQGLEPFMAGCQPDFTNRCQPDSLKIE